MAEHARCRLSESVYVHAIDESEMINPVDRVAGLAGLPGVFWPVPQTSFPPKGGSGLFESAGVKPAKPGNPA